MRTSIMATAVDWNLHDTGGLVSIGTHSLYLRAAGPVRSTGTPAVICIAGLGDNSVSWTAVLRHVSVFARCYIYDRTGLGKSEVPSIFTVESKSYVNIAKELRLLLRTADIKPPYLIAMHSMAGIPGREFINLYPEDVAGMVFVDTLTEENYKTRPERLPAIMRTMGEGVDMSFLWTERKPAMTEEEWRDVLNSEGLGNEQPPAEIIDRQRSATKFEAQNLIPSSEILASKKQFDATTLGDRPVSVIKGDSPGEFQKSFERAVAADKGTEEERQLVRDYLDTAGATQLLLQFKQLRLSRNSRMVEARESWHNVQWYQPDLIAREVKWCLDEFEKLKGYVA
ncbi:Alpha/Beta hydrolase protein [Talaromyces proteolyticus]|uniref:Alpha/Beta hydrolase protein n=1 Tax=Talaromyces proteolyticus TaxID=1131652 RepID=A0AAD4PVD2_9EURO|nr:Alpha/Beta hydrolase protein [Talaromyces proteolyticus]KAH8690163.1 Alpha/Beta hydrolase protein [Talaromyces proteolyticus]